MNLVILPILRKQEKSNFAQAAMFKIILLMFSVNITVYITLYFVNFHLDFSLKYVIIKFQLFEVYYAGMLNNP